MHPQPENPRTFFADTFKDQQVVEAYRHRPPYPQEVFEILTTLLTDEPLISHCVLYCCTITRMASSP